MATLVTVEPAFWWTLREEDTNPLWFLIDPLLDRWDEDDKGFTLIYLAAKQGGVLVEAVEEILLSGGIAEIERGLAGMAASEPGVRGRQHSLHGLHHLAKREHLHAWPPLIIGLEG